MEEYGGPQGYKRGFHAIDFQTEAQHAQTGFNTQDTPEFGAGIKFAGEKPFSSKEVFVPSKLLSDEDKARVFESNYQTMNLTGMTPNPKHELKQTISRDSLENYRKKWSSDTAASRSIRFQTESRRANDFLPSKFQVPSLRMLPGAPKSLENFRQKLIEKYGILAMSILRYNMGRDLTVSSAKLREVFASLAVGTSQSEVSQIIAYFTPSDEINVVQFMRNVVAKVDGFDDAVVRGIFQKLSGSGGSIPSLALNDYLSSETYPVVAEGLANSIVVYGNDLDNVGLSEFTQLHNDLYVSNPEYFPNVVRKLWNL